jgi:hypothetical protein
MNLYEIDERILDCVDVETGEIFDIDKFEELSIEREVKIENICLWIKNLTAEAEAIKAEKLNLEARQKAKTNKIDSLKKYVSTYLEGSKFETARVKVSFRKSESLEYEDIYKIPEEYLKYKEPEVNKTELKNALKKGLKVEGVSIVEKQNIQIK